MSVFSHLFHRGAPVVSDTSSLAAVAHGTADLQRMTPLAGAEAGAATHRLPLGIARYHIFDAPSGDLSTGPTRQPGVMPDHGYEPLRTPFGATGVPGAGRLRNVVNLDLSRNHHADGFPFASSDGRGSMQAPAMARQRRPPTT